MHAFLGKRILSVILALATFGGTACNTESDTSAEYLGFWDLKTPTNGTISFNVDNNGQSETLTVNGEIALSLEFFEDGTAEEHLKFTTIDQPCDAQSPCVMNASVYYQHEYLGSEMTQEGLRASFIRISDESNSKSVDGYVYVSEGRLCFSNNLSAMMLVDSPNTQNSEPLALYFDNCFVKQ